MLRMIIITGTPGVGKTELARSLAKETRSEFLNLSELVKKERLHKRFDKSSQSYIIDERKLKRWLDRYIYEHPKTGVVFDTHSIGSFLPAGKGMIALVLRLDPVLLYNRLRERKWTKRKAWENVESEIIDVSLYEASKYLGKENVYEIDTTRKTRSTVLAEALRILTTGRSWRSRRTNWLEKYDPIILSRQI